jgi:hypothetical protein
MDAAECDAWAKEKAEYSRSAEVVWALFALPLALVLVPVVVTAMIIDAATLCSTPLRCKSHELPNDVFDRVMPKEGDGHEYIAGFLQCMNGRGYSEPPRYSTLTP